VNTLYYGDNLNVLRESIKDESVDLIYLDPPFNSKRDYNVLFKSRKGQSSDAQIVAFEDSWHWGPQAEREFAEILHSRNTDVAEMMQALRSFLNENDVLAYLTMMANRLLELHRVLKITGSLYLHCDPTASHYLKFVLDAVFGKENFRNEIAWKRTYSHGSAHKWGDVHDTIFFYTKSGDYTWNKITQDYDDSYLETKYRFTDAHGTYRLVVLTGMGTSQGDSGKPWRGYNPTEAGRHWTVPQRALNALISEGVAVPPTLLDQLELLYQHDYIRFPKKADGSTGVPEFKLYLGEGAPIQDVITDIPPINSQAAERLGYPTQKPIALLERIIRASSNIGDIVLDPFCGCGTAVHAAQKLGRAWSGIDITHLAISLIEKRLKGAFPGIKFEVVGTPTDFDGARDLADRDKYQFQWWACSLVDAQPYQGKKKGADTGIDGLIFFEDEKGSAKRVIVSVKGGENVGVSMLKDLIATVQREKAAVGLFVTLTKPTRPMTIEAASAGFYESPMGVSYPRIQILTVEGLMNGSERPAYPLSQSGGLTFKRTKVEVRNTRQAGLFEARRVASDLASLPLSAFVPPPKHNEDAET